MEIFLGREDQQAGPFSPEQVDAMIRAGEVAKTDMIWHDGLPCWSCLGMRPEFKEKFEEAQTLAAEKPAEAPTTVTNEGEPPPLPEEVESAQQQETTTATAVAEEQPKDGTPKKYRPGSKKKSEEVEDFTPYVKPVELASRGIRLVARFIDGFALWLCVWFLAAIFLPKGLSLFELSTFGQGAGGMSMHTDPNFAPKLEEIESRFYSQENASWEEYEKEVAALESEWMASTGHTFDAGDRWLAGTVTTEDMKVVGRFFIIAAVFVLLFYILQLYFVATKGQSIGKMFMDVKIVKDPVNESPGFVKGVLVRTMLPGVCSAIPFIGGMFALVNILYIFGDDRRCLHDKMAGTSVVKAR